VSAIIAWSMKTRCCEFNCKQLEPTSNYHSKAPSEHVKSCSTYRKRASENERLRALELELENTSNSGPPPHVPTKTFRH
jgi:hypothetical protein